MVNIMDYGAVAVQCTDGEVWEVMMQCVCVCVDVLSQVFASLFACVLVVMCRPFFLETVQVHTCAVHPQHV